MVLMALLTLSMSSSNILLAGTAATYAMVMLSLVLLTGYGGHVSLAQFTFAGVGALAWAKLDSPNLLGLVLAALVAAAVGALVALPVPVLTGLYLALSTLAFGVLMDKLVFQASFAFGFNGSLPAERLALLGIPITDGGTYVLLMTIVFVAMGIGLPQLRRGRLGRDPDRDARQPRRLRHARPEHAVVPSACSASPPAWPGSRGHCSPGCGRRSRRPTSSCCPACRCSCSRWCAA